jgi:hydantoinase/carbamoylase family amidase
MAERLMRRLAELATLSDMPGGLTRLFLSAPHKQAVETVGAWMREAGLSTHVDAIGNLVGRKGEGKKLLLGSHIDTVRDAGWYDGNFGVLAAIEAVQAAGDLPYAVEIVAFGDEEGVRFPQTLSGARAVAGTFDPAALAGRDANGVSMGEALLAFGGDPGGVAAVARRPEDVLGYVELHIEQGPVLEAEDLAVGVVTAINGASRFAVVVTGDAGHAGTVPMAMRRDALAAAAEMVVAVEAVGRAHGDLVATVGALAVHPGAPNSVPGRVNFSIDVRAPVDEARYEAVLAMAAALERIADSRNVDLSLTQTHDAPAVACAKRLQARLADAVASCGLHVRYLPSGAGHDAMAVADLCDVAMLFVRCKGGVSHTPAESISEADAQVAVDVLISFLRKFKAND